MTTPADVSVESRYAPPTGNDRAEDLEPTVETRWHPATLIAFRFGFVYFGAFVAISMLPTFLIIPGTGGNFQLDLFGRYRRIVEWIGVHAFGIGIPFSSAEQAAGSGDTIFDWVNVLTLLVVAALAAAIWSAVARHRANHARLYAALRVLLRFALGATMLHFGVIKLVRSQMPAPGLARLLEPFGEFAPMSVLWSSIGSSPAYEMIAGAAEVAGGVLVMLPQTTKIGALLCLLDTANVFVLNMTYDVSEKLFALHLLAMSLLLVAPDARGLVNIFVRGRPDRLTPEPTLGNSRRARRIATRVQVIYTAYIVACWLYFGRLDWQFGAGAPRSPLYGIWEVQHMTIDGVERAPLLTDSTRWRRVIFDAPDEMQIQRMPEVATPYASTVDTVAHTIVLKSSGRDGSAATSAGDKAEHPDSSNSSPTLSYKRPERSHLVLDGTLDGHAMHVELAYRDPNAFTLRSRGFHWVQPQPFLP